MDGKKKIGKFSSARKNVGPSTTMTSSLQEGEEPSENKMGKVDEFQNRRRRSSRKSVGEKEKEKVRRNKNDNDNNKSQSSFLQLIRPMIMDQVEATVRKYLDREMGQMKGVINNLVSDQLTLI